MPKSLPQKNYRVAKFSIFHNFSIIISLITQRIFIAKTFAWERWKGYLLSKIFLDSKYDCFRAIPFQINLKKKSIKNVVVGFFYFSNFALKNTLPTSPHTCIQTKE
jgi:hypothetical protein